MIDSRRTASIRHTDPEEESGSSDRAMIKKLKSIRQYLGSLAGSLVSLRRRPRRHAGFTLIELSLTVAITGILGALAVSQYKDYKDRIRFAQAKSDIKQIDILIDRFYTDNRYRYPTELSEVGAGTMSDPWGHPYRYCELASGTGTCKTRKDKSLHPLNSDYDLYSMGKDGDSKAALTAHASRDDIIRARNGQFLGYAVDF